MHHTVMPGPTKAQLQAALSKHEEALKQEVNALSLEAKHTIKNAVFVGGALMVTYLLVSRLVGASERKGNGEPLGKKDGELKGAVAQLVTKITETLADQVILLLLDLAKEKLAAYLQRKQGKNKNTENNPAKAPST